MKKTIIEILKIFRLYKTYTIPKAVSDNYKVLNKNEESQLLDLIEQSCPLVNYSSNEERQLNIEALYTGRLIDFRHTHIPFLNEKTGLKNKQILEIGCGSGSSTVALAEQGAFVTAIDIDDRSLEIAKKRLAIYTLHAQLDICNATYLKNKYADKKWDIIIFFASLEHMTHQERIASLNLAYETLNNGGHLCIFGSPNRLWPFDIHTSYLPFFHWLQDDIAIDYSKNSKRIEFANFTQETLNQKELLYRWGRGISYHEIELAIKPIAQMNKIESLSHFLRNYGFIQKVSYRRSTEYKYKKILAEFGPKNMHSGFYDCYIDVIIKKTI
jgi:S-adenosylmethionine-dependent methyltransferase